MQPKTRSVRKSLMFASRLSPRTETPDPESSSSLAEVENKDTFFALLVKYGARPSPAGEGWAQDNWFSFEHIVDRIYSLQHDARYKLGRNKTILCSVLGACLSAAIETRFKRVSEEKAVIESLQNLVEVLQKELEHERSSLQTLVEVLQKELEYERSLREERDKNLKHVESPKEVEEKEARHIKHIYPQKELVHIQNCGESCCSNLRPLIKTEYNFINEEDFDPHITTKEIPYTATELAKLKKEYSRLPQESETEYVFRVSLTGGDQIKLSEQEASGYWGHGVFLTTGNTRAPWSLTQRTAYWAGGLSPLERRDPLAITGMPDQLLENIHKAACLQMIHERKLISGYESPMQLPVKPEIMTPLIRGLPESLRPTAILLQKTIASITPVDRLDRFLGNPTDQTGSTSPSFTSLATPAQPLSIQSDNSHKVWTWSQVAEELISYSRKYGPVNLPDDKPEKTRGVRHIASPNEKPEKGKQISSRQQLWLLGLKRGVPREVMDGLPYEKLVKIISNWRIPAADPAYARPLED
ncbi:uncharacterized protein [Anomalospiza imberbis]|uniref:uncharacterized protein n=1 Tax=Anomalospiza imberbis TaxID=187417 RepID=UPI00358DEF94